MKGFQKATRALKKHKLQHGSKIFTKTQKLMLMRRLSGGFITDAKILEAT